MATEQRFDNGVMLSYRDVESRGHVVFALYDHGQWSQWHDDGLSHEKTVDLDVPAGAMRVTSSFARTWAYEKLSGTIGYASEKLKLFTGSWSRVSSGGYRIIDSIGRVLLLEKNGLQTWRFLWIRKPDSFAGEMEY